jgi:hypothetical protein
VKVRVCLRFFGFCGLVSASRALRLVELVVEEAESVGLVGQAGVGVRCDHDVGVAEEFLGGDQGDAAFDEQGRATVSEVVEADAADAGAFTQRADVHGDVLRVERGTD